MARQISLATAWAVSGFLALAACGSSNNAVTTVGGGGGPEGGTGTLGSGSGSLGSGLGGGSGSGAGGLGPGGDGGGYMVSEAGVPEPSAHGCDPTCAAAGGTCTNKVCVITENPGNITSTAATQLQGTGQADPSFSWLYPYNYTVFPRGLIPPTLQFGGTAPEAIRVHISYSSMNYNGYFAGSATPRIPIPQATWSAITEGAFANDVVVVEVTKLVNGQVAGPITEQWTIAQGSLRGQIYYETYGSTLAGGPASVAIMSIAPGATQPTVLKQGCGNVCHTASADGSTLVANVALGFSSSSYDLKTNASVIHSAPSEIFTYGGIYPDGSFVISATNYRTWLNAPSRLYSTATGQAIPTSSWDDAITDAGTVLWSPDGKYVGFIREDLDQGAGHTLAMMSYDASSKTFSNLTNMANDPNFTLAWPAFTPSDQTILYHAGTNENFETDGGAQGNVMAVDIGTKAVARLSALDGYSPNGTVYLPANDPDMNFAPTVLPEAVGGYFWTVFTSHRSYGNTLPSMDNGDQNGKLWVAALDLTTTPGKDCSHPAFYLDGQEAEADNLRGFWVLPPCKGNGSGCQTGDQCCSGYCGGGTGSSTCTAEPVGSCYNEYEKCTSTSQCCNSAQGYQCIGGYCSQPAPPPPPK